MSTSLHSPISSNSNSQIHIYDNTHTIDKSKTSTNTPKSSTLPHCRNKIHHPLLRSIWNTDRFNPNTSEKLKEIQNVLSKYSPNIICELYHETTGEVIATATPLIIACFEGDPDVIKLLIKWGADVNQTESEHHLTAIHIICDAEFKGQSMSEVDRAILIRLLVKYNANVNHRDRSGMTALHKAVIHDRPECCQELMKAQSDPNIAYLGDTPLSIASRHNRIAICKILLQFQSTNVNHRNSRGGTPLHYACAALKDRIKCVQLLVESGANVNVQDHKKNTPLMVAAFFGKARIAEFLLEAGADLEVKNNEEKSAIDVADEKKQYEIKMMIERQLLKKKNQGAKFNKRFLFKS